MISVLLWQISKVLFTEASVRLSTRCVMLQQSPNQYARRWPSFSLAVLRRRPTSPSRSILSPLRNRVSRASVACDSSARGSLTDASVDRRRTVARPLQTVRSTAARDTIGRVGGAIHRIIYGFNIAASTSALRSTTEVSSWHFAFVPQMRNRQSLRVAKTQGIKSGRADQMAPGILLGRTAPLAPEAHRRQSWLSRLNCANWSIGDTLWL